MKKKILLLIMCLMVAIATTQAQVEVTSNTKSGIILLRKNTVLEVFGQISGNSNLDAKALCKDKINKGIGKLFRTDLKCWEAVQIFNAKGGKYQKYILTFNEESLDSTAAVTEGVFRSYKGDFGDFTKDLLDERKTSSYSKLVADDLVLKRFHKSISELIDICMKDLERMCKRKKK